MEEQVLVLFAGTNGFVDDYPGEVLARYEKGLLEFLRSRKADLLATLLSTGIIDDNLEGGLRDALSEFARTFAVGSAASASA
jgi:F-type H+-transporting ATPase subunit alpha